jgi:hypothetical protein
MQLTKMKRCQKALFGFKGTLTGDNFFTEVNALIAMLGDETLVETAKYPGVKMPNYFIALETVTSRFGGGAGANTCNFKVYVNDVTLADSLTANHCIEVTA